MTLPKDPGAKPMAEPGKHPIGSDTGGMRSAADAGLENAATRRMERRDENPTGRASTGDGAGAGPRVDLGRKQEPGSAVGASSAKNRPISEDKAAPRSDSRDDEGDEWRHPPVAPKDEGPVDSFGKAISDVVTGPLDDARGKPKA